MYRTDAQTGKPRIDKRSILGMLHRNRNKMIREQRPDTYDQPGEWAQNILCFGYDICRAPLGGETVSRRPCSAQWSERKSSLRVEAFTQSGRCLVTMNYHLRPPRIRLALMVRDATGREVETIPISRTEGQAVATPAAWPPAPTPWNC